ncbi:hypothetical protein IWQ51_004148 [Labrenzia sp. EL_142]|nr:hypothetical protein [Labrenzia sp. EL_142]
MEKDLAPQPSKCRLENLPCSPWPRRWLTLLRLAPGTAEAHGGHPLRLFNALHDEYGFQLIVVFEGPGRFVDAVLRPARPTDGVEVRPHLHRLVRAIGSDYRYGRRSC